MKKLIYTLLIVSGLIGCGLLPGGAVWAQPADSFGLAMHGTPKYGPDASHLDYANPAAPQGGTLRQAAIGTFDTLNPFAIKGKAAEGLNLVYDRLMARVWDEPFTMYPLIAERVDVPADRSGMTVHINPAARFHDGSAITADDVIFSFETLKKSGRPNMRRIYELATDISKIDDRTVSFKFGPGYDRETVMIFAMMPVLSQKWWEGRTFDSTTLDQPLGNGPYKIAEVDPGRRIVYERVRDYWANDLLTNVGHHNFDRIVYDYYRDDMVALEAFKAGNLDVRREWDAGRWVSSYDFPAVRDGTMRRDTIYHNRAERVRALIFNTRRAPFDNRDIRVALSQALDFDWLNKNIFHSQYAQIASYYPNTELAATGEPSALELAVLEPHRATLHGDVFGPAWQPPQSGSPQDLRANLRRATQLLEDNGWVIRDGKRVHAETGKVLTFEIILSAPEDEKIALAYIRNLRRLGVEATVRVLDSAAFLGRMNEYDFDMVLYYWQNSLSPGTEQMLYWSCESAKIPARWNFAGICDPAVDDIAARIANAQTREELVALTRALDRVLTWGTYMVPLYYGGKDYMARKTSIRRPEETPLYGVVLETWWAQP